MPEHVNITLEECNINADERELFTGLRDYILEESANYEKHNYYPFQRKVEDIGLQWITSFLMNRGVSYRDAFDFAHGYRVIEDEENYK